MRAQETRLWIDEGRPSRRGGGGERAKKGADIFSPDEDEKKKLRRGEAYLKEAEDLQ